MICCSLRVLILASSWRQVNQKYYLCPRFADSSSQRLAVRPVQPFNRAPRIRQRRLLGGIADCQTFRVNKLYRVDPEQSEKLPNIGGLRIVGCTGVVTT